MVSFRLSLRDEAGRSVVQKQAVHGDCLFFFIKLSNSTPAYEKISRKRGIPKVTGL